MARQRQGLSTTVLLLFFLLLVCCLVTGSLYLDLRHKNGLLEEKVAQLEKSQVLLMVPDEQAKALADWMENNPEFTQSIIKQAEPGSQVRVEIGPEVPEAIVRQEAVSLSEQTDSLDQQTVNRNEQQDQTRLTPLLPAADAEAPSQGEHLSEHQRERKVASATDKATQDGQTPSQPVKLSEDKDGVKVISLPHGGIRVTTREDN
ncbi:membrane anchored protein in chemotaxis locus [Shewanella aegiceratis]|uniref:membrane anchored protein in chemotaxis locus n=1 Tax=Shewanella aegiceratis TaxID=2864203 RepID=UPI001C65B829|nr:membrane anchored protein in chemotaxis locus [Shewanella aegiceratis]QYJ83736.1 membrane anchored protein in chemotaxis locus [Shewanella aegiceratis]